MSARRLAPLLLVAAVLAAYWWLSAPPGSENPRATVDGPPLAGRPLKLASSAECRACHAEVYDEWARSHHGLAYVNPEVQALTKNFRDRDCLPCHAPQPVFETGLENRVLERQVRLEEGVDCFACHRHHDAILGGAHVDPASQADCNPRPYPKVGDVALCAPCHDQHKVVRDWRQTEYAVPGPGYKDCTACHFPPAPRAAANGRPAYVGKSHACPGAHDAAYLKTAASYRADFAPDGALEFEVKNDGTGHNFPSDERHRSVDLVLATEGDDGSHAVTTVDWYRNPYRDEFHLKRNPLPTPGSTREFPLALGNLGNADVRVARIPAAFRPDRPMHFPENRQIPAGEARRYRIFLPRGVRRVVVRVYYKLKPPATYDEATLLYEKAFDAVAAGPGVFGADGFTKAPERLPDVSVPLAEAAPSVAAPAPVVALAAPYLDPQEDPRTRAARILALGGTPGAVDLLRYLMKDRSQSAFVLLEVPGAPLGVRVEENPFGDDLDRSLDRMAAISALEKTGSVRALPELLLALDDRDRLAGAHAARAAVRLGARAGIPALIDALEGKAYVNEHAVRFLRELTGEDFGFRTDAGSTLRGEAVARWRTWWAEFERSGGRLRGEGPAFRRGADAETDRRLAAYVEVLGGFQFLYMEQARKLLRRLGPEATGYLREALPKAAGDRGATWRGGMAHVLGGVSGGEATALLAELARDSHPTVRSRAAEAAAERGGPQAGPVLRAALADPDPTVVAAAARGLGLRGERGDAETLDRLASSSAPVEVRAAAAVSAMRLAPDRARFERTASFLKDASVAARTAALDGLNGLLGRKVLEDPLAPPEEAEAALAIWRTAIGD
jgi:HEAT repeat protein